MKNNISSGIVGFLFALGLGISGMTQPQKIIGFLDIFGNWDPTLVFVMLGAVFIHSLFFKVILKRPNPLFATTWHVPSNKKINTNLILGSFMFGVGWGLAGYCPGPAIVSLASFQGRPLIFVLSMFAGMLLFKILDKKMQWKR